VDFGKLIQQKTNAIFQLNIQNLTANNIYIEKNEAATIAEGYLVTAGNEVSIQTKDIQNLYLIAEGADATDVRVI